MVAQGDAEDLPFPTDRFDRYVSAGSIEYWPEPERGIKEAYRVVKEGGLACIIGPVHPTFWLSRFFADVWMLFPTEDEYIEVLHYLHHPIMSFLTLLDIFCLPDIPLLAYACHVLLARIFGSREKCLMCWCLACSGSQRRDSPT